jgi:putative Mg2+ transporter-C (MgtC) family protein
MLEGQFFEYVRDINNVGAMLIRLAVAALCGGLVGIERGQKRRPAGFRTYMIVCMAASLTMIIGQFLWHKWSPMVSVKIDVARFGAQVINGIGFLGAGTIIVTGRQEVKGLTTAAGLWASACMGLAIGAGFVEGALLACLMIVITITILAKVEHMIMQRARNINVYVEFESLDNVADVIEVIKNCDIRIFDVEINRESVKEGRPASAVFSVRLPKHFTHVRMVSAIAEVDAVKLIEEV